MTTYVQLWKILVCELCVCLVAAQAIAVTNIPGKKCDGVWDWDGPYVVSWLSVEGR